MLIVTTLCLTNPSKSEFVEFAIEEISQKISEKNKQENILSNHFAKLLAGALFDSVIEHHNFIVFSTYSVNLSLLRAFGGSSQDIRYIGIGGQFIPLNSSLIEDRFSNFTANDESNQNLLNTIPPRINDECPSPPSCNNASNDNQDSSSPVSTELDKK